MALTKIGKEGITGISNSSDATFLTATSSEGVTLAGTLAVTGVHTVGNNAIATAEGGSATTSLVNGLVKAWSHFDPNTGNDIRDSLNITSAGDNGTGDYSHNFTNNMNSSNYVKTASSIKGAGAPSGTNYTVSYHTESYATNTYGLCTVGNGGGSGPSTVERDQLLSAIIGDLA